MRARPRPGMLTQPGCSHPFPSTRMLLMQKRGESRAPVDAGPPAPGGPCGTHTAPPGRRTVGVCELTKLGEVGAGGGTRGPRRPARGSHPNWKEPVLPEEPLQPRAPRGTLPGAPHPTTLESTRRGRQWACKGAARRQVAGGHRAHPTWSASRKGADALEHARAPHFLCSKAPGSGRAGRAEPRGWG